MEANDNAESRSFELRRAHLMRLVENLCPGLDGRAGCGAIYRELDLMRPGSLDQAHATHVARRMNISGAGLRDGGLPDLAFLDYPEPAAT